MVAPNYAAARSELAKRMGLGQQRRRQSRLLKLHRRRARDRDEDAVRRLPEEARLIRRKGPLPFHEAAFPSLVRLVWSSSPVLAHFPVTEPLSFNAQ